MNQALFDLYVQKNIPIAWEAGVRFENYTGTSCSISVTFGRMNQNPFGSMFWAVEGMAAEFAGGMLLLSKIRDAEIKLSTLVAKGTMVFNKKAKGKIVFTCEGGEKIDQAINHAIETNNAQVFELTSTGVDESGDQVAEFVFTWSIKVKE